MLTFVPFLATRVFCYWLIFATRGGARWLGRFLLDGPFSRIPYAPELKFMSGYLAASSSCPSSSFIG